MDLQLKNRFYSHGLITETVSTVPKDLLQLNGKQPFEKIIIFCCLDALLDQERILEIFLDEPTIQEIVSTAHYSGEIITNITSPFLTTDCELLCLGKIVPELRSALGPTLLYAEVVV